VSERLQWERDGRDWPHREASQFIEAGGLRWHVQIFEFHPRDQTQAAPVALLIHGTGASTHSWRDLAPLLAKQFTVLTMDLPGHGFTDMPAGGSLSTQLSLPGMANALGALIATVGMTPALVIGHSAGAAIAVRMCLDGTLSPKAVIGLNAALLPLGGLAGKLFSPVAKLMAATPLLPRLFSWRAGDPAVVRTMIDSTGSTLNPAGLSLYGRLVSSPGHAAGALGMMANWDLDALAEELPRLQVPLGLIVGSNDRTILPAQSSRVLALLPPAIAKPLRTLEGLGHLAHEERPELVADAVLALYRGASQPP
jgi:magnesium chelatase accessory protein